MKKIVSYASCFYVLLSGLYAQEVIIKGTLRCINTAESSTKGAVNIIIIPSFNPKAAVATTTTPQGFFQISSGWKAKDLKDKNVTLYIITKCSTCKNMERIFISEDLDKRNTDPDKMYVTIKGWKILENCKKTELADLLSEKLLDSARHLPPQSLDGIVPGSPAMASLGFVNLFQKLVTAALVLPATGDFAADSIYPGKIKFGQFLQASAMTNTDNTGFNFSPSRNISEAIFFNAAAIAHSNLQNNISLLTNFKNNFKFSCFKQVIPKLYVGLGGIYTRQDELRSVQYIGSFPVDDPIKKTGRISEKLKEFAVFLAPVYAISRNLKAGITVKSIWQQFNNPRILTIRQDDNGVTNFYSDDTTKEQHFDADISVNYKINGFLQVGITAINITGSKLYADNFIKKSPARKYANQRSYAVGICYKHGRLNVGLDALLTNDELYDVSAGINYVPVNNGLLAAGYAFKQKSFSASARFKYFKIAYIYDNNLMVNDINVGKSKLFNGKIYSGIVINF